MYELEALLSRLKMEHLSYHVESLLEQAAKKELNVAPLRGEHGSKAASTVLKTLPHFNAGGG